METKHVQEFVGLELSTGYWMHIFSHELVAKLKYLLENIENKQKGAGNGPKTLVRNTLLN